MKTKNVLNIIRVSDPLQFRKRVFVISLLKGQEGIIWLCTDGAKWHFAPTALRSLLGWHEMNAGTP